jgi:hypothetical protein
VWLSRRTRRNLLLHELKESANRIVWSREAAQRSGQLDGWSRSDMQQNPQSSRQNNRPSQQIEGAFLSCGSKSFHLTFSRCCLPSCRSLPRAVRNFYICVCSGPLLHKLLVFLEFFVLFALRACWSPLFRVGHLYTWHVRISRAYPASRDHLRQKKAASRLAYYVGCFAPVWRPRVAYPLHCLWYNTGVVPEANGHDYSP